MSDITREDLDRLASQIKAHVDLRLEPLAEKILSQGRTLYGSDGRNGVVGDVSDMKSTFGLVKWFAGLGGVSGLAAAISRLFGGHE